MMIYLLIGVVLLVWSLYKNLNGGCIHCGMNKNQKPCLSSYREAAVNLINKIDSM